MDHPCKETCSGWQQGYDRGLEQFKKSQNDLIKEREELRKHAANQRYVIDLSIKERNDALNAVETFKNGMNTMVDRVSVEVPKIRAELDDYRTALESIENFNSEIPFDRLDCEDTVRFARAMARSLLIKYPRSKCPV